MTWSDRYVGIPFKVGGRDRAGIDCWGLLRLVYAEQRGIDLPSWGDSYDAATDRPALFGLIDARMAAWKPLIDQPKAFDGVLLSLSGLPTHIGVMVDRVHFLHAREGHDSAVERVDSAAWRLRVAGFYRYMASA